MSRPLRLSFPGAIYHITSRGNAREAIYLDDADRQQFLSLLAACVERFHWIFHAYCLMDNHYHLLIETPNANLQEGMRQLNGVYTQAFNRRHARVGHVFQGRYKSILVERDSYLLELCRYIVLNPVRAQMVEHAGQFVWSSYQATVGLSTCPAWLQIDWVLAQFAKRLSTARTRYANFVQQGLNNESPWKYLKGQVLLGNDAFVKLLQPLMNVQDKSLEIPKTQRLILQSSLDFIFKELAQSNKVQRNLAIKKAYLKHGYSMAEIARFLNMHYSSVSKIIAAS
jgi:putative transposase